MTRTVAKCLLTLAEDVTILDNALSALVAQGVRDIVIVTGHAHDSVVRHLSSIQARARFAVEVIFNDRYDAADNIVSLSLCHQAIEAGDGFLLLNSDVVFHPDILGRVLVAQGSVLAVDTGTPLRDEEMKVQVNDNGNVTAISKCLDPAFSRGEYIGLAKFTAAAAQALLAEIVEWVTAGRVRAYYEDALHEVLEEVPVRIVPTGTAGWVEVDTPEDLAAARALYRRFEDKGVADGAPRECPGGAAPRGRAE